MKLELAGLKTVAQLPARYTLAKTTHHVSVFTEGMLQMKSTLLGIVEVNPHAILQDGIRKELVRQISSALHQGLVFDLRTGRKRNPVQVRTVQYSTAQYSTACGGCVGVWVWVCVRAQRRARSHMCVCVCVFVLCGLGLLCQTVHNALQVVHTRLSGFRKSFEYIQDYISTYVRRSV